VVLSFVPLVHRAACPIGTSSQGRGVVAPQQQTGAGKAALFSDLAGEATRLSWIFNDLLAG
jgi:hypothetical protein